MKFYNGLSLLFFSLSRFGLFCIGENMTLVKAGGGVVDIRGQLGGVYFHRDKSGLHSSSMPRTVRRRSAAQSLQRKAFVAARALSTDNRTVSYLMYRYMNGLPFLFDAIVTGNPDPDCKGTYVVNGTHDGEDLWERSDSAFFIWYYSAGARWCISPFPGATGLSRWYHIGGIEGIYSPYHLYTGNPVVSIELRPPPIDYQIPKL